MTTTLLSPGRPPSTKAPPHHYVWAEMRARGMKLREIAAAYKVTQPSVSQALSRLHELRKVQEKRDRKSRAGQDTVAARIPRVARALLRGDTVERASAVSKIRVQTVQLIADSDLEALARGEGVDAILRQHAPDARAASVRKSAIAARQLAVELRGQYASKRDPWAARFKDMKAADVAAYREGMRS
jgi:hypothetical protein